MTVDDVKLLDLPRERRAADEPSYRRGFRGRLLASRGLTLFAIVVLAVILLGISVGPLLWRLDSTAQDLARRAAPPSLEHPLGTDTLGRDVLSRLLHGGRVSLALAFGAVFVSTLIAAVIGLLSGYFRGITDAIFMRIGDVMLSIPTLLMAVTIAVTLGPGLRNTVIALVVPSIPRDARIIRAAVLSVRERDYVFAARASGVRPSRIMVRHVFANTLNAVLVVATVSIGFILLEVASLGFLGLGVQPPDPEWGAMLTDARTYIISRPLVVLAPGLAIFLTALASNIVGDAIRDAFDTSR